MAVGGIRCMHNSRLMWCVQYAYAYDDDCALGGYDFRRWLRGHAICNSRLVLRVVMTGTGGISNSRGSQYNPVS